jgi:Type IV secretion system pilin
MKRLRLFIASLAVLFCLVPALPASAATNVFNDACQSKGAGASAACQTNGKDPISGSNGLLTKVTKLISYFAGASSVLLIVVAAIMYVTSEGDSGKIQSAKMTLIYAVIGLVIVAVSQSLIVFVLRNI